jgi:ubiquinone/menaquinone biosynthesis C-methylase UbiE
MRPEEGRTRWLRSKPEARVFGRAPACLLLWTRIALPSRLTHGDVPLDLSAIVAAYRRAVPRLSAMHLPRVLEPEVMDTEQEASDYDAMDHTQVNMRFCDDLLSVRARLGRVLDVGTGTARIPIELCRRETDVHVLAIDLAASMLAIARRNVERAGLTGRVALESADAKATRWDAGAFDAVISNSIVHHIPDPREVLREMWRLVPRSGILFVRDLARPESADRVRALVSTYAPIPEGADPRTTAMHARQRDLFAASLYAALTVEEVAEMATAVGMRQDAVQRTSDRHWTLMQVKS